MKVPAAASRLLSLLSRSDEARTKLWPQPVMAVAAALVLGVALPRLDAALDDQLPGPVTVYLFGGGASAARTVLSAIATSLISVTSLTFSLTVVTLQLASSQYSPRLLRTFTRDRFVHSTLALFLGSFVFALTVLRTVRTPEGGQDAFVPQLSVTVAFALALSSVLGLVLFLAHLAREIRVETILRNVHEDASETIERVLESRESVRSSSADRPIDAAVVEQRWSRHESSVLLAPASGFLVAADLGPLGAVASELDARVVIDACVGDALVEGTPVGRAWPSVPGAALPAEAPARLRMAMAGAFQVRFERTGRQDVAFGLRQVVDVAVRALSPGVNDPTTAVHAVSHLSAILCELMRCDLAPVVWCDDDGGVRVLLGQRSFDELLDLALCQPRIFGNGDPYVVAALLELLADVAWMARTPEERNAIRAQLDMLVRSIDPAAMGPRHSTALTGWQAAVVEALGVA